MTFFFRKPRPRRLRRPAWRPGLEALEDRALPSTVGPVPASPLDDPGPVGYTPAQIRQVYGFNAIQFSGSNGAVAGDGSGQTIAIVTAGHDPNLAGDLHAFDQQFGLADPPLKEMAQDGSQNFPAPDGVWVAETALDVEWAHAIAPGAALLVVDAAGTDQADLFAAVDQAARQPGVSVVSMSFGSAEDPGEAQLDAHFTTPAGHAGVVFVAAAGDTPGVSYPAASPNVIAVGGTTLTLDASNNRASENPWVDGGGGLSEYEPLPDYQADVLPATIGSRGTPDVAYAADPAHGFAVYFAGGEEPGGEGPGWITMGGTSAGAPQWAALVAIADQGRVLGGLGPLDSHQALTALYALPASAFYQGAPLPAGDSAGYTLSTGRGSPLADQVVAGLVGYGAGSSGASSSSSSSVTAAAPPAETASGSLTGQPVPVAATDGAAFNGAVAALTDSFSGASPDTLTVVINWGDGQTSGGIVTPAGSDAFTIDGAHTYEAAGDYTISVTVTDTGSGLTAVVAGTADVQLPEPDPAAPLPLPPLFFIVTPAPATRHGHAAHHPAAHRAAPRPAHHPAHHRTHVVHVTVPALA